MKTILERKNAKAALKILKENPGATSAEVANKLGIWYNVANFLVKELKSAGHAKAASFKDVANQMHSKQSKAIKGAFMHNKLVTNKILKTTSGVSAITQNMKQDLDMLVASGFVKREKQGNQVVFKRV